MRGGVRRVCLQPGDLDDDFEDGFPGGFDNGFNEEEDADDFEDGARGLKRRNARNFDRRKRQADQDCYSAQYDLSQEAFFGGR